MYDLQRRLPASRDYIAVAAQHIEGTATHGAQTADAYFDWFQVTACFY
jgi:hypothetical protein